jgi:co-chaperonin GroES (HSP10)
MKVLGPRVAIKIVTEKTEMRNGLYLPDSAIDSTYPLDTAEILEVGSGFWNAGVQVPIEVKVGDLVILPKMAPKMEYGEGKNKIYMVAESELAAVIGTVDENES